MVLEEVVEILYRLLQIAALVKHLLRYPDESAILVSYDSGSSRHIVDQRDFSKGISRIVVDALFLSFIFFVFAFNAVDSFEYDVEVVALVSLLEDDLMGLVVFEFEMECHFLEGGRFGVERLLDEDDFLD